jgi:putative redox protein
MPPITSRVEYQGQLRTKAIHLKSGEQIITDAPPDNNGKGAYFSPTDLTATSLACCMLTLMGIHADKALIHLEKIDVDVTKLMGTNPRRIVGIKITMRIFDNNYTTDDKKLLELAALTCPVAKSLHPEIEQDVTFNYVK